jgi:hypothetical protein
MSIIIPFIVPNNSVPKCEDNCFKADLFNVNHVVPFLDSEHSSAILIVFASFILLPLFLASSSSL